MPYTINGQSQDIPEPEDVGGATFVPLAKIVETLGGYVTWDNTQKIANVELGDIKAAVQLDNGDVDVNGSTVSLSAVPAIAHNTLWVPVDLFSEALGCEVTANGNDISISNT